MSHTDSADILRVFCFVAELLRVVDEQFRDTTVISIAHRLNFIRDSDRILVLNTGGTINAFGTPDRLLEDPDGYFAKQLAEENATARST